MLFMMTYLNNIYQRILLQFRWYWL